ncbi:unnamed protein product [marine sediment metagenome]|uniref:Uncharacterized protein n=1 Tax=marine sediment metagenome TaxID=412755 RepID=X0RJS1_9ZZZZ
MKSLRNIAVGIVASVGVAFVPGASASAAVLYNFTGQCSADCTGSATGVLTLNDSYTPGSALALADFVSFVFVSDTEPWSVLSQADVGGFGGALPVLSGIATFGLIADNSDPFRELHSSSSSGGWSTIDTFFAPPAPQGRTHLWELQPSPVPLPAALPLYGTGLGLMGLFGWWRRRRAAAA